MRAYRFIIIVFFLTNVRRTRGEDEKGKKTTAYRRRATCESERARARERVAARDAVRARARRSHVTHSVRGKTARARPATEGDGLTGSPARAANGVSVRRAAPNWFTPLVPAVRHRHPSRRYYYYNGPFFLFFSPILVFVDGPRRPTDPSMRAKMRERNNNRKRDVTVSLPAGAATERLARAAVIPASRGARVRPSINPPPPRPPPIDIFPWDATF